MKKYEKFTMKQIGKYGLWLLLWFAFPALTNTTTSVQNYSPEQLVAAATKWLEHEFSLSDNADIEVQVSALDNRLGNRACTTDPSFSLPAQYNPRQTTVQVSCAHPASWQIFIPVRLIEWLDIVVVRQNITPGTVLTADILDVQRRERRLIRGTIVQDPALILGSKNKRSLSVGQIINLADLCLVCRGDVVTIQVANNGLSVSATGVAQQDGSLGDSIAVRNQQSGRQIQAEVVGVNQVRVKF